LHGLAVPHRIEIRWNGILTGRHELVRFATTAELPDALFEFPRGYTLAAPGGPAAVEMIADGVAYVERIGGGYRMLVVDTDEGLVVVDAPISVQATSAALGLIAKAFPERPIRYLVLTHHHGDHIAGLGALAGRGTTVLVAPGSEAYLRRMSTVRRTIGALVPPDSIVAPQFETVRARRRIGKGARSVEVIDASPTSHASSMLVVYLPSQRLLFQGDLLRINRAGGPVVSPDATRDLERIIRRERLDVRSIGAVHGLNGTMEDLRAALARGR
jgi:glyoxylase-like metal-dependent hydrolase (beta-lactamase superfamily II)